MAELPEIDWSKFDEHPESTCTCACGTVFRSHAKATVRPDGDFGVFSRIACPGCGEHDRLQQVTGDPETVDLRGSPPVQASKPYDPDACPSCGNPKGAGRCLACGRE